ncbi:MAG: TetR/AcrR family transcriptional regulator [Verrucomicrobiaceae bacterium]|nr:MAG: TetR/AcrR family transcriptional regulator [Verrucomicrobiaceae bacterium]
MMDLPKTDPRVLRTRQMLFRAFQEMLAEKSFDLISVQDIAGRATLNRATFYDHFTDKFALLNAMISERFTTLIAGRMAGTEPACETSLRHLILAACDFLSELSAGCQKNQRQFEPIVESCVRTVIRESILEGLRHCQAKDPELKATMVSWAVTGAAIQWNREKSLSAEELTAIVLPTVLTAMRAGG